MATSAIRSPSATTEPHPATSKQLSTSKPSFDLYWPSSVNFIETDAAECSQEEIADAALIAAKPGVDAASEHSTSAAFPFAQTQPHEAPGYTSEQGYSQLGDREVRLLKLYPGDYDDGLLCELEIVDLRSQPKPEYDALSYTWADNTGDKTESQDIYVMGRSDVLKITRNCANALRRLRNPQHPRTLWVDSICINQKDHRERSHQVGTMSFIYATATRVLIYLGEDPEDPNPRTFTHWLYERQFNTIDLRADFSTLPYFSRTWVIQEVANAAEAWCFYGSRGSKLEEFLQLNTHNRYQLMDSHPWLFSISQRRLREVHELPDLLLKTRACLASDPRDKVFALLGLLTGTEQAGLVADYSLSLPQVLIGVAMFIMQLNTWKALAMVQPASSHHLPSWAVDWTTEDHRNGYYWTGSSGSWAGSSWYEHQSGEPQNDSYHPRFHRDGTLVLKGTFFSNLGDCTIGEGAKRGPPGFLTEIRHQTNYYTYTRQTDFPDWAQDSDKLFRVRGSNHFLILRPVEGTKKHNFVAICDRSPADRMAPLLESLERVPSLLVSTWNEILFNKNSQDWFQSEIWDKIKKICALIKSFYPRFTADTASTPDANELSKPIEMEMDDSQGQEDSGSLKIKSEELPSSEQATVSDMIVSLRRELRNARNCGESFTSPFSAYGLGTRDIETADFYLPSVVQACWDWRQVANTDVYHHDYSALCKELNFHKPSGERKLYWTWDYFEHNVVQTIFTKLNKLLCEPLDGEDVDSVSADTILHYLMSQRLSLKVSVLDQMLRQEYSKAFEKNESYHPHSGNENFYQNAKATSLLTWVKMSLNLDQSEPMWGKNGEIHDKPWGVSFLECYSQLLHVDVPRRTQSQGKETRSNTNIEDSSDEARTPGFTESQTSEGRYSWERGSKHDAWKLFLELVEETERHLLPLEGLFKSRGNVKTSSDCTEEEQWEDLYIV